MTLKTRNVPADTYDERPTQGADVLSPDRIERVLERWMSGRRSVLASDESGMTLIEILVAVFILAVAVIAVASTAAASLQSVRESRERQDATQLASTVIEEVRALPFSDIALDESTVSETTFEGEDILAAPGGTIPHVRTDGNQTATTYITVVPTTAPVSVGEELRVTVLVTWGDVDGQHTVRQETRIAEATRGLPVPSFTVSPTSENGTGVPGETICMDHTLRNLGEQDAYSWQLWARNSSTGVLEAGTYQSRTVNEPDGSGGTQSVTRQGFKVPSTSDGAHWFGWARMAIPASSSTFQPMVDDTGDLRPDSPSTVLALGDAKVRFCYTALSQAGVIEATDGNPALTPRIYSAFDDTVNTESQGNELSNTINVVPANTNLYLREVAGTTKTMTTDVPTGTDETVDYDGDGTPGLHLDGTFDLTSWAANVSALGFSSLPRELSNPSVTFYVRTDDDSGKTLVFDVRLLRQSGANAPEVLSSAPNVTVASVTTAWQPVSFALPLSTPVSVDSDDTLFLEIDCDESNGDDLPESEDDCHIHYDVTTLASRFSADFQ